MYPSSKPNDMRKNELQFEWHEAITRITQQNAYLTSV